MGAKEGKVRFEKMGRRGDRGRMCVVRVLGRFGWLCYFILFLNFSIKVNF